MGRETLEELRDRFIVPVGQLPNGRIVEYKRINRCRWECFLCNAGKNVLTFETAVGRMRGHLKTTHRFRDKDLNIETRVVLE